MFRTFLVLALALSGTAADRGIRAQFAGGTVQGLAPKSSARLFLTNPEMLFFSCGETQLRIDYHKINTLEYGQNVSRRYAAAILISPVLLLAKSRRHFITLGYLDTEGKQQALVLRIVKGDIRSA